MEVNIGLMTRDEMLTESTYNKNHKYTTEEMAEDGDYVYVDRNGYLTYANGEEVIETEDLPEDGWYDCTDVENLNDTFPDSGFYDSPLYDDDDEW